MAILSDYTSGAVTASAGGTAVTGTGTAWKTAGFREGDLFMAPGWVGIVKEVTSETSLTLYATGLRGDALSGSAYRLRYMSDGSRASAQARQMIDLLGSSGNLEALAGLLGTPDTVPYFTGPGTMGLAPFQVLTGGEGVWNAIVPDLAGRAGYIGEDDGFRVLVLDADGNGRAAVYVLTSGSWSDPIWFTGGQGEQGPGAEALDELTDVSLTTPADYDGLVYDDGAWVNKPVAVTSGISRIVKIEQSAYDALDPPDNATLYLIMEDEE